MKDKLYKITELDHGVVVKFYTLGNRYFGDFHRVRIKAVATIPIIVDSLPAELCPTDDSLPDFINYEKMLERMGVATCHLETVTDSLIDDFLRTVGGYLEKKNFAECLLRKNTVAKSNQNYYGL